MKFVAVLVLFLATVLVTEAASEYARAATTASRRALLEYEEATPEERDAAQSYLEAQRKQPRFAYYTNGQKSKEVDYLFPGMDKDTGKMDGESTAQYLEGVFNLAAFTAVMIIVTPILGVILLCLKCCMFGGWRANKAFFFPTRKDRFDIPDGDGYSKREVWIFRGLTIALLISGLIFSILAYVGTAQMTTTLYDTTGFIIDTAKEFIGVMDRIDDHIASMSKRDLIPGLPDKPLSALIKTGNEFVKQLEDANEQYIVEFNGYRDLVMYLIISISLFVFVVPAAAGFLNWHIPSLCCTIFALLLVMPTLLTLYSIHQPLNVVMADICYLLDLAIEDKSPSKDLNTAANTLFNCKGDGAFAQIGNLAQEMIDKSNEFGCKQIPNLCTLPFLCVGETVIPWPPSEPQDICPVYNCSTITVYNEANNTMFDNCTFRDLSQLSDGLINDYQLGCPVNFDGNGDPIFSGTNCFTNYTGVNFSDTSSYYCDGSSISNVPTKYDSPVIPLFVCDTEQQPVRECGGNDSSIVDPKYLPDEFQRNEQLPQGCTNEALKNITFKIQKGLLGVLEVYDILAEDVAPLTSCKKLTSLQTTVKDQACVRTVNSLGLLNAGLGGLIITYIAFVCIQPMAFKRFNKRNHKMWSDDEGGGAWS